MTDPTEKKKRGPKPRVEHVGLLRTYGSGYINVSQIDAELSKSKGNLELKVVSEARADGTSDLVYGLFYVTKAGEYFDVIQAKLSTLRTFTSSDAAASFIATFAAKHGDRFYSVAVPAKIQANVIELGSLRKEYFETKSK